MTTKFDILDRYTGAVQFTAAIAAGDDTPTPVKLGLAVRIALKARANLSGADLSGANLSGADLYRAKKGGLAIARTRILPEGALIGWKKCCDGVIVKLRIPEEAARSHAFGRKCRAQFADVLEVRGGEVGISRHDGTTEYRVGQRVTCDVWGEDWQEECSGGIHFFITQEEAEAYF